MLADVARVGTITDSFRQKFFELDRLHVTARLGSFRADVHYWGVLGQRWWRNYLHAHSFYELCFAYQGGGTFRMLGTDFEVRAGDLFIAKPGETHEIVSSKSEPLGIYFWAFTLVPKADHSASDIDRSVDALIAAMSGARRWIAHSPPEQAQPRRGRDGAMPGVAADTSFESTVTDAQSRAVAGVERTLGLLNTEIAEKPPGYTQAVRGLTVKLLLDSARAFTDGIASEQVDTPVRSTAQAVVRTATRYLRDNLSRPIEVRDVAAQVHLSERHLSRLFHKETGTSILEHLTGLRIEMASQLLMDNELSIKQVARAVGYPDPHYFTTLFGRRTGMTPAVFRNRGGTKFSDEGRRTESQLRANER